MKILAFEPKGDNDFIRRIRKGDEAAAKKLYNDHAEAFINYAQHKYRTCPLNEIEDAWQEAFTAFILQARAGKFEEIKYSIKSILFAIGRNKIKDAMKKLTKTSTSIDMTNMDVEEEVLGIDEGFMKGYQHQDRKKVVLSLLEKIGDPCKTVLELAFFKRYPPESIAAEMNYSSEQTARVRKSRCLSQMAKMLKDQGIVKGQFYS